MKYLLSLSIHWDRLKSNLWAICLIDAIIWIFQSLLISQEHHTSTPRSIILFIISTISHYITSHTPIHYMILFLMSSNSNIHPFYGVLCSLRKTWATTLKLMDTIYSSTMNSIVKSIPRVSKSSQIAIKTNTWAKKEAAFL